MKLIEMSEAHSEPWHPYNQSSIVREYEDAPLDPYGLLPDEVRKNTLKVADIIRRAERRISSTACNTGAEENSECEGTGIAFNVPDFEGRQGTVRVHLDFSMPQPDEQREWRLVARDVYFIYPNGVGILNKTIFDPGDSGPQYRIQNQRFVTRGEISAIGVALAALSS